MKFYKIYLFLFSLLISSLVFADDDKLVSFESHNLHITLDVANQTATIVDSGVVTTNEVFNNFMFNLSSKIESFTINNKEIKIQYAHKKILRGEVEYHWLDDSLPDSNGFGFQYEKVGTYPFTMKYTATFNDDVENARFSNENVGREVTGTILEKGAYLSSSSYFYPQGKEEMASFSVTANIPSDWESISDGNKMEQRIEGNRKIQKWVNPYKSDGIMFMAAPYVVKDTTVNDINIACYFFAEDTSLFESYLSATVGYIEMYSEMIGPYPYKNFTVAENFFPTGYGMPGWTLLGQQVIRLPFIKYTSLGHEVLHNWWGNSVYVDYERGNWCESATVYGADYRYKLMRSESSATAYRKDILKQYVSYVNDGNDFPIREFKSRTSKNTRTIGYNKAMIVYHMIEEEIGSDAFWQTWKDIYAKHITQKISWEEWIDAFEKSSGKDLSHIIPQWIDQTGAPLLSISDVITKDESGSKRVTFKLSESSGGYYILQVPIRFSGSGTAVDTIITLANNEQIYQLIAPVTATKIEIDPEFHLFRKLYPEEVEPIISAVLGYEKQEYVYTTSVESEVDMFHQFAKNMNGEEQTLRPAHYVNNITDPSSAISLNPERMPEFFKDMITGNGDSLAFEGTAYPMSGHTFVLSCDRIKPYEKMLFILTSDFESLPRIGQLIPHYGKYSYLVFEGSKNVAKGQWEVESSPLKVGL